MMNRKCETCGTELPEQRRGRPRKYCDQNCSNAGRGPRLYRTTPAEQRAARRDRRDQRERVRAIDAAIKRGIPLSRPTPEEQTAERQDQRDQRRFRAVEAAMKQRSLAQGVPRRCETCGKELPRQHRGRPRKFCDQECRNVARRHGRPASEGRGVVRRAEYRERQKQRDQIRAIKAYRSKRGAS